MSESPNEENTLSILLKTKDNEEIKRIIKLHWDKIKPLISESTLQYNQFTEARLQSFLDYKVNNLVFHLNRVLFSDNKDLNDILHVVKMFIHSINQALRVEVDDMIQIFCDLINDLFNPISINPLILEIKELNEYNIKPPTPPEGFILNLEEISKYNEALTKFFGTKVSQTVIKLLALKLAKDGLLYQYSSFSQELDDEDYLIEASNRFVFRLLRIIYSIFQTLPLSNQKTQAEFEFIISRIYILCELIINNINLILDPSNLNYLHTLDLIRNLTDDLLQDKKITSFDNLEDLIDLIDDINKIFTIIPKDLIESSPINKRVDRQLNNAYILLGLSEDLSVEQLEFEFKKILKYFYLLTNKTQQQKQDYKDKVKAIELIRREKKSSK